MQGNVNIPDSTITTNLSFRQLVLMNMQQLTNFPYIEKDFDALTDYELLCLVVKFLNDVIANQNEQNDSITRMYESFLALQDYVNNTKDELEDAFNNLDDYVRNYFDNLDVKEEINNKLDQMLEDGVLEQIIEQFFQSTALWCFDNVASMKLATNLTNGSYTKTLGYYNRNDGGSAIYKIRTKTNDDVADEMFLIDLYDNTLIAELNINEEFIPEQLGAKNDGSTDASDVFAAIFNKMENNNKLLMTGTYLIDSPLYLPNKNNIVISGGTLKAGENLDGYILNSNQTASTGYSGWSYKTENLTLENVFLDGSYTANGIYLDAYLRVKLISCTIHNIYQYGIYLNSGHECQVIGTNIIGKTNGDEEVESTGIVINSWDNIIDSCVIAYCQWAIDILKNTNQICNSHFYCNRANGGNIKITKAAHLTFTNNYFDGSGVYAINPYHLLFTNSLFVLSDSTQHVIKFDKDGNVNPNLRGVIFSNTIINDLRTDKTTPYQLIEVNFQPNIADTSECYIDKISYPSTTILNNPYNIFSFKNSNIPIIVPDSFFKSTNNSHTIGTHDPTTNWYTYTYNGNFIDSVYTGSTSSYPWLFFKIYVPEKMLVKKEMISSTSADVDFWDSNETYIGANRVTLDKGIYYVGIYRTHTILLNTK